MSSDKQLETLASVADPGEKYSVTGGPFGSDLKNSDYTEAGVRVIQLQNIGDGEFIDKSKIYTSEEKADELSSCNIYPGDIIIAKMAEPLARATLIPDVEDRYLMCSDGIRLKVNEKKFNPDYICRLINSHEFRNEAERLGTGTTRLRIGLTALKNIAFFCPPLRKQNNASHVLKNIDSIIEHTSELINKLKNIRSGLLEDFFSCGVSGDGSLRNSSDESPELYSMSELGLIPEGWKVEALDFCAAREKYSLTGGPFGSDLKNSDYTEAGVRVIQLQNIGDGEFIDKSKIYTSEEKADELSSCNIYPGDIIIAKMAEPLARATLIPDVEDRYLMCSDGIRLCVDKSKHCPTYIVNFINNHLFRKQAERIGTGTTRLRIGLTALRKLKVKYPPFKEQKEIGKRIEGIDELINGEKRRLKKYVEIKTGLTYDLIE